MVNAKTGQDASGHTTLRSALQAANARPLADTIILPAGTITLSIAGAGENNARTGDLDVRRNVTIKGAGAGKTFIDARFLDRVFDIFGATVAISGVTIENGMSSTGGGGLLNEGGHVTLSSVTLQGNVAVGVNGANGANASGGSSVGNPGAAGARGTDAEGGAIMNASGSLTITNSFVSSNLALAGDGGNGGNGSFGSGPSGLAGANGTRSSRRRRGAGGNGGNETRGRPSRSLPEQT